MRPQHHIRQIGIGALILLGVLGSHSHILTAQATSGIEDPYTSYSTGIPLPASSTSGIVPNNPSYTQIQEARLQNGQLKIFANPNSRLRLKGQFILERPTRLVIDIADAKLENTALSTLPTQIDNIPIGTIRFAQFTTDTVRLVIETPTPEKLRIGLQGNSLTLFAEKERGLFGAFYKHLFQHNERPDPTIANTTPRRAPKSLPIGSSPTLPAGQELPPGTQVSTRNAPMFPQFENLQKLQRLQNFRNLPSSSSSLISSQRLRIIEIARSQVGLSKDTNREYVMQTFSQGRDNAWCADFASTILDWAGGSPWGHLSRVEDIYNWGTSNGRVSSQPEVGTLVILRYGGSSFDHIAFVESVNPDSTITTIGGNEGYAAAQYKTSGTVNRSVYSLDDKRILGFVDPIAMIPTVSNTPRNTSHSPRY